jgi:uncharacterized membrane protein
MTIVINILLGIMETNFKKAEIQKAESVYTASLILVSHFVAKYTQILGNRISLSRAKGIAIISVSMLSQSYTHTHIHAFSTSSQIY